jgi:RNA polymerase sigma-70 factor (ECF subfamily)
MTWPTFSPEYADAAVKMAVYRLRARFRAVLQEEISQTVTSPGEVEEEIRYLLGALSL